MNNWDSDYFKVSVKADGVFQIMENTGVSTFLIAGNSQALLIDTGYGFSDLRKFVKGLTDLPLTVVNTHGHLDHAGGNFLFDEVYINYAELPVYYWYQSVEKPIILEKFQKDDQEHLHEIWPSDFLVSEYMEKRSKRLLNLQNGRCFDLGGRIVETIFLPGHTTGSVVFLDRQSGLLFAGDNIAQNVWLFFDHSAPVSEWVKGLDGLRNREISGILSAHSQFIYPRSILDWLMLAAVHKTPSDSRLFVHPRTGRQALSYKQKVAGIEGLDCVRIVYPITDGLSCG